MIKTTSTSDYDFQQSPVNFIKVARAGVGSNDLKDFIKKAGDEAAFNFSKLAHYPGEEYLHLLAMGATEIISPNRNGDGWAEKILLESHPSFTKYAYWHRNHKVDESDGVYGKVRADWYNKKMGRVELLVGLFSDKKSAQAGHAKRGRVADKELHMLGRGTEMPVSMSGFVPFDVCSGCGHQARGRAEYCRGEPYDTCKYGGLFKNAGRVFEDGHHLHMVNPKTRFFDISGIFDEDTLTPDRQADRIAYVIGHMKSASAVKEITSVPWWAYEANSHWARKQGQILPALVQAEKQPSITYSGSALPSQINGDFKVASTRRTLDDLAKQGVCLSLADFAMVCGADETLARMAEPYAKTAFARLASNYCVEELLEQNPFCLTARVDSQPGKALFSMAPEEVRKRAWLDADYQESPVPEGLVEGHPAEALSDLHALYRLGFAASLEKSEKLDLIFSNIARHNRFQ